MSIHIEGSSGNDEAMRLPPPRKNPLTSIAQKALLKNTEQSSTHHKFNISEKKGSTYSVFAHIFPSLTKKQKNLYFSALTKFLEAKNSQEISSIIKEHEDLAAHDKKEMQTDEDPQFFDSTFHTLLFQELSDDQKCTYFSELSKLICAKKSSEEINTLMKNFSHITDSGYSKMLSRLICYRKYPSTITNILTDYKASLKIGNEKKSATGNSRDDQIQTILFSSNQSKKFEKFFEVLKREDPDNIAEILNKYSDHLVGNGANVFYNNVEKLLNTQITKAIEKCIYALKEDQAQEELEKTVNSLFSKNEKNLSLFHNVAIKTLSTLLEKAPELYDRDQWLTFSNFLSPTAKGSSAEAIKLIQAINKKYPPLDKTIQAEKDQTTQRVFQGALSLLAATTGAFSLLANELPMMESPFETLDRRKDACRMFFAGIDGICTSALGSSGKSQLTSEFLKATLVPFLSGDFSQTSLLASSISGATTTVLNKTQEFVSNQIYNALPANSLLKKPIVCSLANFFTRSCIQLSASLSTTTFEESSSPSISLYKNDSISKTHQSVMTIEEIFNTTICLES